MRTWGTGLVLLTAVACSGIVKTVRPPSAPLALTTVFVYPVRLGTGGPAWRSFELSQRMIDVGLREAGDSLAFYGPSEFKVLNPDSDQAWVATSALPILTSSGSRADQGVMLRAFADMRVASSQHEAQDAKGKSKGATSTQETTWAVRVELLHPTSKEVLAEVSGQVTIDPFAEPGPEADFDPAPPFTRLLERLAREAVGVAASYAAQREVAAEHALTLAATAALTMAWEDERPSAAAELARLDPLEAELFVQNRTRFLSPWLTFAQAAKLSSAPAGLAVIAVPSSSKLAPGELIERVDGRSALPQTLARVRFLGRPVQLQVRRADGSQGEIVFP